MQNRVYVAESTNEKVEAVERQLHKIEQYFRRESIEILSATNNLLEKHVILIFKNAGVELNESDIFDCYRWGSSIHKWKSPLSAKT